MSWFKRKSNFTASFYTTDKQQDLDPNHNITCQNCNEILFKCNCERGKDHYAVGFQKCLKCSKMGKYKSNSIVNVQREESKYVNWKILYDTDSDGNLKSIHNVDQAMLSVLMDIRDQSIEIKNLLEKLVGKEEKDNGAE